MGRPAKYSNDEILDAAAQLVAMGGPGAATITAIAGRLRAPSGSIYHRFASRDLLVAHLWIHTVRQAQQGFADALNVADVRQAAVAASLHVPRWSRANLDRARVLLLHRRDALVERWPDELGDELAALNSGIGAAINSYTLRRYGTRRQATRQTVSFALIDVPYGAVHRYLQSGTPPPRAIDDVVVRTAAYVLDTLDER